MEKNEEGIKNNENFDETASSVEESSTEQLTSEPTGSINAPDKPEGKEVSEKEFLKQQMRETKKHHKEELEALWIEIYEEIYEWINGDYRLTKIKKKQKENQNGKLDYYRKALR